jgi:sterol desaturase/sphingolipid hydroxylase (fatty acid hydroxylase superfamily)
MNYRSFISKLNENKKQIVRYLGFYILLRSVYGGLILALVYFFDLGFKDLREFEILGLRAYFLILAIMAILMVLRFRKLYKWWAHQ